MGPLAPPCRRRRPKTVILGCYAGACGNRGTGMSSRQSRDFVHRAPIWASGVGVLQRRVRRSREKRSRPEQAACLAAAPAAVPPPHQPDPVRLAVLAMETLGRASLRASFTGVEVSIAAPDEEIAAIFRAALAQTSRSRATDRLIRIVVE